MNQQRSNSIYWAIGSFLPQVDQVVLAYHILESVERNDGIVSMVVMTALRTIAKDTHTLSAKVGLLDEGSSSKRYSLRLKGF